jgi:hypothetical protein
MARPVHENYVRVWWLTTLADTTLEEVTLAEIAAGTELAGLTADGLNISPTNNKASLEMLDSEKIPQFVGTRMQDLTLKFVRETVTADDDAWELFDHGETGYLVVSRLRSKKDPSPNLAAGDRVEIYKVSVFDPQPLATAANTFQQFEVPVAAQDWETKAEVVAS